MQDTMVVELTVQQPPPVTHAASSCLLVLWHQPVAVDIPHWAQSSYRWNFAASLLPACQNLGGV